MTDDVDALLARMRGTAPGAPIAVDPAFPARLRASARRGGALAAVRATAIGLAAAAVLVLVNPPPVVPAPADGTLLTAMDGAVL